MNGVAWEVDYTDVFEEWWRTLDEAEQASVGTAVEVLAEMGPALFNTRGGHTA